MTGRLVLASASPRRRALLAAEGLAFDVVDPGLDDATEDALARAALAAGHGPRGVVLRLALAKLLAAARRAPGRPVLAADTLVAHAGDLLAKARDAVEAERMLRRLCGAAHEVLTGVALLDAAGALRTAVEVTTVRFAPPDEAALAGYVQSGLWRGKAGAYGLQDPELAPLVAGVEGSRSNVVGLPVERVRALLALAG